MPKNYFLFCPTHPMISESDLAELIFRQVTDSVVWCRLSQVSKRFNEASKRLLIKKERKDSIFITNDSNHVWTELPNNGIRHGHTQEVRSDGKCVRKGYYLNGLLHGLWFYQISNQTYTLQPYIKGARHGNLRTFSCNGGWLMSEYNYSNNELNGLTHFWYPNGKLHFKVNYYNNQFHGLYQEWDAGGYIKVSRTYNHGICVSVEK